MKKSLYSLILADDVVAEIDRKAAAESTNRSNLINEILAEYVALETPNKRVNNVFMGIKDLLRELDGFNVYYKNHDNMLSIKSALSYKYRPTIRYEVELMGAYSAPKGILKVNFRTQSPELLFKLAEFFRLFAELETLYTDKLFPKDAHEYSLEDGRFTRTFTAKAQYKHYVNLDNAIANFVKTFDRMMKNYLSGGYESYTALENDYLSALNAGMLEI